MTSTTQKKRNTGPVAPGDVFWVEDYGQQFLIVVVQAVPKRSDAMVVYVFEADGGLPDTLVRPVPDNRVLVAVTWKASRSAGGWSKVGAIDDFDPVEWPMPNFKRRVGIGGWAVVVPHRELPGHTEDAWNAEADEVAGLFDFGISDEVALLRQAKRAIDPTVEFPRGSSQPL